MARKTKKKVPRPPQKSLNDAPTPVSGKHTEFIRSLFDRTTLEHADAVSQFGLDPEGIRQVMYVQSFLMKFTMWEKDDLRVFFATEKFMAVDDILRLFDSPLRERWAVPWIDEAASFRYVQKYVQLADEHYGGDYAPTGVDEDIEGDADGPDADDAQTQASPVHDAESIEKGRVEKNTVENTCDGIAVEVCEQNVPQPEEIQETLEVAYRVGLEVAYRFLGVHARAKRYSD